MDRRPLWRRAPACCCRTYTPWFGPRSRAPARARSGRRRREPPRRVARGPRVHVRGARTTWCWRWRALRSSRSHRRGLARVPPDRAEAIAAVATGAVSLDSEERHHGLPPAARRGRAAAPRRRRTPCPPPTTTRGRRRPAICTRWFASRAGRQPGRHRLRAAIHQVTDSVAWRPSSTTASCGMRARSPTRRCPIACAPSRRVKTSPPSTFARLRAAPDRGLYFVRDGHWTPAGQRSPPDTLATAVSGLLDAR